MLVQLTLDGQMPEAKEGSRRSDLLAVKGTHFPHICCREQTTKGRNNNEPEKRIMHTRKGGGLKVKAAKKGGPKANQKNGAIRHFF